ncbi:uncharacterized protein [Amphiura filiformis]|uniref:uncharacterized protein n=1 Tax=Amphiura filiformis TaxID=82378 RepID=UPI003B21BDE3
MLPRQHVTSEPIEGKEDTSSIKNLARNQDNLTRLLVEQHKQASLPKRTLQAFTGDPLQYVTFIRAFEFIIENKSKSNRDRLYYLEQYTRGEANSLVKSCIHMDDEVGYLEAKRLLERKYGNKHKIAEAYLAKMRQWPNVKGDSSGLQDLSLFLLECKIP